VGEALLAVPESVSRCNGRPQQQCGSLSQQFQPRASADFLGDSLLIESADGLRASGPAMAPAKWGGSNETIAYRVFILLVFVVVLVLFFDVCIRILSGSEPFSGRTLNIASCVCEGAGRRAVLCAPSTW